MLFLYFIKNILSLYINPRIPMSPIEEQLVNTLNGYRSNAYPVLLPNDRFFYDLSGVPSMKNLFEKI